MARSYVVARNKTETSYKSFICFLKGGALRNCSGVPQLTWHSMMLIRRQRRRAWEDQAVIGVMRVMLPGAKEDYGRGSCKRQGFSVRPSGRSTAPLTPCRPLPSEPRENKRLPPSASWLCCFVTAVLGNEGLPHLC